MRRCFAPERVVVLAEPFDRFAVSGMVLVAVSCEQPAVTADPAAVLRRAAATAGDDPYDIAAGSPAGGDGDHDNIMVGFHIENAIYGPLYYGYEDDGTAEAIARNTEGHIMEQASDMVMVMLKARPEVIARRMKDDPQLHGVLQEKDVEHVLKRFDEEFKASTIRYKFVLDTSDTTAEETFNQFVTEVQPLLRESDMLRMLTRRAVEHGG